MVISVLNLIVYNFTMPTFNKLRNRYVLLNLVIIALFAAPLGLIALLPISIGLLAGAVNIF